MKSNVTKSQAGQGNELMLQLPAAAFLLWSILAAVAYCRGWWPFN